MKSIFKKLTAALAVIVILYGSCKNPAEDVQVIVNTDIFKSPVLLEFVNAKEGIEGPKNFNVEIIGPNANLVCTSTGGKTFKASSGLLNLMLDRAANPSETSPVKFTVVVHVPGFAPTYKDVVVTSPTDPRTYIVEMVEYANPAISTGAVVTTKTIANGTASTDLVFTTATNAGMANKSDVIVSTGTSFLDAAGLPVGGSQVEAKIVYFGVSATEENPTSTPGAGFASNVIDANGKPITSGVFFNSAGTISIDMVAGTKEVKGFTKAVTVDMEVDKDMINPNTNQAIKENETIPLWSLNNATGQWKSEGNATFVNVGNKLVARMQITHLSSYSPAYPGKLCRSNDMTITRTYGDRNEVFDLDYPGIDADENLGDKKVSLNQGETSKSFKIYTPQGRGRLIIKARSNEYRNSTITSALINFCNDDALNRKFNFFSDPSEILKVSVYVKFKCSNKDLLTGVNAFIKLRPMLPTPDLITSLRETVTFNLINGRATGTIINGRTYEIIAAVDGATYTGYFSANQENSTLNSQFDGLKGTLSYDATSKVLSIDATVTKDCN